MRHLEDSDDKIEPGVQCVIGNYLYNKKTIGLGSFAKVYKGINKITNEIVAIKKINIETIIKTKNISDKKIIIDRVLKEVEILKKLNHINIIKHIDNFTKMKDGKIIKVYIVTEYYEGIDLTSIIDRSETYIQFIVKQIISGLDYLYSEGIVHRDLKPQNILITNDDIIKIIDFGLASEWINETDMFTTVCGTPLYIAPEILCYKQYGIKADLWSLGIILYELLYNKYPFVTEDEKIPTSAVILFQIIKKTKSIDFPIITSSASQDLINSLLKINPDDRLDWNNILNHEFITGTKSITIKKKSSDVTVDICDNVCGSPVINNYSDIIVRSSPKLIPQSKSIEEDDFCIIEKSHSEPIKNSKLYNYIRYIGSSLMFSNSAP